MVKSGAGGVIGPRLHVRISKRILILYAPAVTKEVEEQTTSRRPSALVKTALWLKSKMGNQCLAGQVKRYGVPRRVLAICRICHRKSCIDECNVARSQSDGLVVVCHRQLSINLKHREVVVRAIQANISIGPLDALSVAANVKCRKCRTSQDGPNR